MKCRKIDRLGWITKIETHGHNRLLMIAICSQSFGDEMAYGGGKRKETSTDMLHEVLVSLLPRAHQPYIQEVLDGECNKLYRINRTLIDLNVRIKSTVLKLADSSQYRMYQPRNMNRKIETPHTFINATMKFQEARKWMVINTSS